MVAALQARQLTEGLCHADETSWRVFESIDGKVGYRWYLWVIRSTSAIVYVMAPGRGADVPLAYFSQLLVQTVVVCDRYAAYKKLARLIDLLLAFCWAHVRRDFLTLARSYPDTEAWAMGWVQRIGTLYHLNDVRLAVHSDPARFAEPDRQLRAHLEQMSADCCRQRADARLPPAAHKVLVSLQNHWEGLTVFVDRPEIAMDNNRTHAASGMSPVMPTPGLCRVLGANREISGESRLLVIGWSALSKALKEGEQGVCGLVPGRHETARLGARGVASAPVERFMNSAITLSSRPAKPMFCCVIQSAKAVKIRRLAFSDWGA